MKKVLITGASKGLGEETARYFASHNYDVLFTYNQNKERAQKIKKELEEKYNIKVLIYKLDLKNEKEIVKLFDAIEKEVGDIDCLINNAAIAKDSALEEKEYQDFQEVINTNLVGTFLVIKSALRVLKNGTIINIASTNGIDTPYIESIDYDASKAGVISLTHNFAKYLAPDIRVNAIAPGWIETDMTKEMSIVFKKEEEEKILLNRFASAEEIAKVIYFIASEDASYINDTVIRVDGGKK